MGNYGYCFKPMIEGKSIAIEGHSPAISNGQKPKASKNIIFLVYDL